MTERRTLNIGCADVISFSIIAYPSEFPGESDIYIRTQVMYINCIHTHVLAVSITASVLLVNIFDIRPHKAVNCVARSDLLFNVSENYHMMN